MKRLAVGSPSPHPDRPGDVFDCDLPAVVKNRVDTVGDTFVNNRRDANAAGLGERLEPRGEVDAVAVDVVAVDDDVAQVNADPEHNGVWASSGLRLDGALNG